MELRYLTTYDEHGNDTGRVLQYWNSAYKQWFDVEDIRCRFDDEKTINKSPLFMEE